MTTNEPLAQIQDQSTTNIGNGSTNFNANSSQEITQFGQDKYRSILPNSSDDQINPMAKLTEAQKFDHDESSEESESTESTSEKQKEGDGESGDSSSSSSDEDESPPEKRPRFDSEVHEAVVNNVESLVKTSSASESPSNQTFGPASASNLAKQNTPLGTGKSGQSWERATKLPNSKEK